MTGSYVRIERKGKWQSVEIDKLTDQELDDIALEQPDRGWHWAKVLVQWIRYHTGDTSDF